MSADAPTPLDLDAIRAECDLADRDMRKWVRYPVKHLRSLLDEAERLRAEVARLTARPTWDEEAAAERAFTAAANAVANDETWAKASERSKDWWRLIVRAALGDHPPVKPDRETVIAALAGLTREQWDRDPGADLMREALRARFGGQADAVLSLLPGRSEAEVKAEALREWGGRLDALYPTDVFVPLSEVRSHRATDALSAVGISRDAVSADMMRHAARVTLAEADRLAAGGGAS